MGSADQRRALLLGLVEVIRPVKLLDEEVRGRISTMCHVASTTGHVEDPDWLGRLERGFMGVEVILDQQHLHITSDDVLVSRHDLAEVCAIMKVERTEGHLVFVGRCQVKDLRLAVVLDMMSELDAQQLEDDVRHSIVGHIASLEMATWGPLYPQLTTTRSEVIQLPCVGSSVHGRMPAQ